MSKSHLHFLLVGEARHKNNFLRHIYLDEPIHVPVTTKTTWQDVMDALRVRFAENLEVIEMIRESEVEQDPDVLASHVLSYEPEEGVKFFAIFDIVPTH